MTWSLSPEPNFWINKIMEKQIIKDINSSISKDDKILSSVIKRLINYYIPLGGCNAKQKREIEQKPFEVHSSGIGSVYNKFKRNFHCNIPWIDDKMWNTIKLQDRKALPRFIRCGDVEFAKNWNITKRSRGISKGFSEEIRRSDRQSWKSYTTRSRFIPTSERDQIARAGIQAARKLGIISNNYGRENTFEKRTEECVRHMAKNTNSCWPFFKRKNNEGCIKDTINWLNKCLSNASYYTVFKNPLLVMPCTIFHRIQPSVDLKTNSADLKIRQVWGQPQRIICLEYYFFGNLFKRVFENTKSSDNPVYSTGLTNFEISQKIISKFRFKLFNNLKDTNVWSIDYSKYDRTIPNYSIDIFFAICKSNLNMNNNEKKLYEILRLYLKHMPYIYDNKLFFKMKGISSGSYITNLFDTWWNLTLWILSHSIVLHIKNNNLDFNEYINNIINNDKINTIRIVDEISNNLSLCGDDALIYCFKDLILIHKTICVDLGMDVGIKHKTSSINQEIYFLGRYWDYKNRPVQSELYMSSHIVIRTKWYNKEDLDFNISEELDLNRILSICLPLYNGKRFLDKYFKSYKPYIDFINSNKDFSLLKEWPNDGYIKINSSDSLIWEKF